LLGLFFDTKDGDVFVQNGWISTEYAVFYPRRWLHTHHYRTSNPTNCFQFLRRSIFTVWVLTYHASYYTKQINSCCRWGTFSYCFHDMLSHHC
jgi:hypothetical protein